MHKRNYKEIFYNIFIKYQGLAILLIIIDQVSKILALKFLKQPVYVFGLSWLQLKLQINPGIAFSFLDDAPQFVLALISIVTSVVIEYYIIAKKPKGMIFNIILLVLVAGSIGNGIDRTLSTFNLFNYTGVVDFIYVTFFANFNFADICVVLSCIFLLIYFIFTDDDKKKKDEKIKEVKDEQ